MLKRLTLLCTGREPGDVGLRDLAVARQAEQQGHVDVDAVPNELLDAGQPLPGGRHLDHDVRAVHGLPQVTRLRQGAVDVPRQVRIDLQAYKTVTPLGIIIKRSQEIGRITYIPHRQCLIYLRCAFALPGEFTNLVVVVRAAADRLVKNGRIGRHAPQAFFFDAPAQGSRPNDVTTDEVLPDALAVSLNVKQWIVFHGVAPLFSLSET